jgi:hypothetical protein
MGYGKIKMKKAGLKMVKDPKTGKMVPFYAADGKGKMKAGGMANKLMKTMKYKYGSMKKMAGGYGMKKEEGGLKTPTADQKGLKKLPKSVRNKMGYKMYGGLKKKTKKK